MTRDEALAWVAESAARSQVRPNHPRRLAAIADAIVAQRPDVAAALGGPIAVEAAYLEAWKATLVRT